MRSEISFGNIPNRRLTKLLTNMLTVSEHEDAYMRVGFEKLAKALVLAYYCEKLENQ